MRTAQSETLGAFFSAVTQKHAKRNACTWRPTFRRLVWTYEELWNHAAVFSDILAKHNIKKGERVILVAFNSPHWVAAFFAMQLRGAIAVPLSPESPPEFIAEIAKQTNAKAILRSAFVETKNSSISTIAIETIAKPNGKKALLTVPNLKKNAIAEIVYTSGTTGNPKGVVLTHANILANLAAARNAVPINQDMRFASVLPLFHMFEQLGGLLAPLSAGAQISYAASLNPNHLKWIFQDDHITRMLVVPEFLRLMRLRIKERAKEEGALGQLETLLSATSTIPFMAARRKILAKLHRAIGWNIITFLSGGAALDKQTGEFWEQTGIYILQAYGLTETSPGLTANRYRDRNLESVGKPLDNVLIKIADDKEILAKGPNVFPGYWSPATQIVEDKRNGTRTKDVFDKDGWFHTGDIGEFDANGHLHVKGRKKFMIVLPSGENVYAEDIEAKLNKQPGVRDSAVIGIQETGGERVHAVLLLERQKKTETEKLVQRVNDSLLPYQRIQSHSVWPHSDFPRTPTRKIKKREVAAFVHAQKNGGKIENATSANLSKVERIIAQVLETPEATIKDSQKLVADLNLDSLRRIELVARIENELAISVDESELTPETTVQNVKEMIESRRQNQIRYPFKKKPFTGISTLARKIYQPLVLKPIVAFYAPMQVYGRENLENLEPPALFFSNHISGADAPVIYATLPPRIRAKLATGAAADRIYDESAAWWTKLWRGFFEFLLPIFPFARENGQGKASLTYTGRIIDRGFSVLLFPEGQTSKDGTFLPLKQGAGLLGVEMRVPVVPIKLEGTQYIILPTPEEEPPVFQWPKRHKVTITIGQPFTLEPTMDYEEATSLIEKKMKAV